MWIKWTTAFWSWNILFHATNGLVKAFTKLVGQSVNIRPNKLSSNRTLCISSWYQSELPDQLGNKSILIDFLGSVFDVREFCAFNSISLIYHFCCLFALWYFVYNCLYIRIYFFFFLSLLSLFFNVVFSLQRKKIFMFDLDRDTKQCIFFYKISVHIDELG